MTLQPGCLYKTRDGSEVRIYATDGHPDRPVHGAVKIDGHWHYQTWMTNGDLAGMGKDSPWCQTKEFAHDIIEEKSE